MAAGKTKAVASDDWVDVPSQQETAGDWEDVPSKFAPSATDIAPSDPKPVIVPPGLQGPPDKPSSYMPSTSMWAEKLGAPSVRAGIRTIAEEPSLERKLHGVHQIGAGVAGLASPGLAPAMVANPIPTLARLAQGVVGQQAVTGGLDALGVPQGYSEVAGDMTGLGMSGVDPKTVGEVGGSIPRVIRGAVAGGREGIKENPWVIPAVTGAGEILGGHQGAAAGGAIGTGLVALPGAIRGGMEAYRSGLGPRLAAEHRAGPQPVPSWRGNPTPVVTPPSEVQPISGPLPSGRQPGPAPPGPEFPNRQIPAWANMPTPTPTSVPKMQSIPSVLPSGRQVGPAPATPEMQGRAIPAWANLPEPVPQPTPVVEPQPPAQLPSGRQVGGISNMKPIAPTPSPEAPAVNGKPDAQAAAEALKNEMGGTPGEPMVIPSTEPVVTKAQGEGIGRMKKVQALMEQLRKNGVTPQTYKSLTSQERASVERMIQERTGDSAAAKAQILSALRGEDIPKFAKGGIVAAPIPKHQSKPGRTSSRGIWYGPPGSSPGMSRHA